jgi:hypothetical protein
MYIIIIAKTYYSWTTHKSILNNTIFEALESSTHVPFPYVKQNQFCNALRISYCTIDRNRHTKT